MPGEQVRIPRWVVQVIAPVVLTLVLGGLIGGVTSVFGRVRVVEQEQEGMKKTVEAIKEKTQDTNTRVQRIEDLLMQQAGRGRGEDNDGE